MDLQHSPIEAPAPDKQAAPEAGRAVSQFVVGIGASAGGLEAIEHFFEQVPPDSGLTFVVVQHLSPDFKSLMDELLARRTKLPIHRVEDGMAIQPNAIYLIPRKKNMVLSFGKLMLTDQDQKPGPNLPIDIFFQSLAHDMGERAVAVVLSGTGSDGSRGIKEVHEAGGLVIVQDPDTAGFDGMPKAALATGLADLVMPPSAMPAKILQYTQHPVRADLRKVRLDIKSGDELSAAFSLLRRHFGVDFSLYKPSTLARRMERRMTLQNTESLADYVSMLETDPDELDHLYRDLLVEVTQFFRDKDAFDILKNDVIPKLFEQASADDGLRNWVPGCATGEEAYSLAMLFHEYAQTHKRNIDVEIFATDVHRSALEAASAGVYREASVADMPRAYLERYFVHKRNQFVVNQDVRKLVIFAPHNLTKDPPFTKLDLISCRNVLIYLNPATQRKVLTLFHFGLRTGGIMFLGPSSALHQAVKSSKPIVYSGVRTKIGDHDGLMKVSVVPLPNKRTQSNFFQVCLEPEESPPAVEPVQTFDVQGESAERISSLERELMYTKEYLQSTIEELETSNEELQSTNEELGSAWIPRPHASIAGSASCPARSKSWTEIGSLAPMPLPRSGRRSRSSLSSTTGWKPRPSSPICNGAFLAASRTVSCGPCNGGTRSTRGRNSRRGPR